MPLADPASATWPSVASASGCGSMAFIVYLYEVKTEAFMRATPSCGEAKMVSAERSCAQGLEGTVATHHRRSLYQEGETGEERSALVLHVEVEGKRERDARRPCTARRSARDRAQVSSLHVSATQRVVRRTRESEATHPFLAHDSNESMSGALVVQLAARHLARGLDAASSPQGRARLRLQADLDCEREEDPTPTEVRSRCEREGRGRQGAPVSRGWPTRRDAMPVSRVQKEVSGVCRGCIVLISYEREADDGVTHRRSSRPQSRALG